MRLKYFATVFVVLVFISCNQNASLTSRNEIADSIRINVLPVAQDSLKNAIDLNSYEELPFWTSDMEHMRANGYIDTFTIGGSKLRIAHQTEKFDGIVEVNKNGKWFKVWQFESLGNHNDYERTRDLNRDGYNDLIFYWKWYAEVHFFDPAKGYFPKEVNCRLGESWDVLDSAAGVFYEINQGKLLAPVESNLFMIKKNERIDLADLTLTFDSGDENYYVNKAELHFVNSNKIEEIKVQVKTGVIDFDYKNFWKEKQVHITTGQ
jgi:hypothetical protein